MMKTNQSQAKAKYACPTMRFLEVEAVRAFAALGASHVKELTTVIEVDDWGVVDNEVSFE